MVTVPWKIPRGLSSDQRASEGDFVRRDRANTGLRRRRTPNAARTALKSGNKVTKTNTQQIYTSRGTINSAQYCTTKMRRCDGPGTPRARYRASEAHTHPKLRDSLVPTDTAASDSAMWKKGLSQSVLLFLFVQKRSKAPLILVCTKRPQ